MFVFQASFSAGYCLCIFAGKKSKANPIVQEEPPNIHVTGFRDPFVARCKEFDELLGGEKLYGLLSGGIHEEGPRLFLYSVDPVNVENWEYLATLLNGVPISFGSGSHFAGDFGRNLECGSFVHLKSDDGKYTRLTFLAGAEGGNEARHVADYAKNQPLAPHRAARWTNWFFAHPKRVNHAIDLDVKQVGRYDNGIFYAAAPQTLADGRIILHGWIIEEDLPLDDLRSKGWTGDLGVPREIFLQTFEGIESGLETPLAKIESLETVPSPSNSTERTRHLTFGIRPFREVDNLRGRPLDISLPSEILSGHTYNLLQDCAPSAELRLCFRLVGSCNTVRVWLRHNKRLDVGTILEVDLIKETIRVDRSASNSRDDIHKSDEIGAFTLFKHQNEASISACEDLQLRIFMDHNILEVFANDRFAMSTRIYAPQDCRSVSVGFEGTSKFGVDLVEAIAWPMKSIGLADLAKTVQFTHL